MRYLKCIIFAFMLLALVLSPEGDAQETAPQAALDRIKQEGMDAYDAADYQTAIQHWQAGLEQARALNNNQYISRFLTSLGVVYHNLGQNQRALGHHEQALAIRREMGDRRGEGSTLGNLGVVYDDLGQSQRALEQYEQALAQEVAALRAALHAEWGNERGLILSGTVKTPESRLPFAQLSHALYTLLIPEAVRPLLTSGPASHLPGKVGKALIIVPTGPLYTLPFELLLTRPATTLQEAQYLVEEHPISYLSSASLLNTLREAQARRTPTARYPLLAFAHPTYRLRASQEDDSVRALRSHSYRTFLGGEFTELPETADETRAIADLFKAPQESDPVQLRAKASRANVLAFNSQNRLDDYHYLIFAMHGVLPDEVSQVTQSALVLSDDFLTMADVFGLRLNAKLVSLSACNTGRGAQVNGEGVMGLTRAFMYAGTPTVAVTLWSVESLSAKDLNIGFFRHLKDGLPPAQALQAIKVQMLQGDLGDTYRHPYYWAPFVIFGDGKVQHAGTLQQE